MDQSERHEIIKCTMYDHLAETINVLDHDCLAYSILHRENYLECHHNNLRLLLPLLLPLQNN